MPSYEAYPIQKFSRSAKAEQKMQNKNANESTVTDFILFCGPSAELVFTATALKPKSQRPDK
jgi:hypothetical protein